VHVCILGQDNSNDDFFSRFNASAVRFFSVNLNYRNGRFFAIANNTMHMITGTGTGDATIHQGGTNGLGKDALENAAQIDTGETKHVALLFSPDYGEQRLRLYVGKKGYKTDGLSCGNCTGDALILARNGLAYGSWWYHQGNLPSTNGATNKGTFGTVRALAVYGGKLEDVSTNPNKPTQGKKLQYLCATLCLFISRSILTHVLLVVLADQSSGVYILDYNLSFPDANFSAAGSSFSMRKLNLPTDDYDKVEWSKSGDIFMQMDNAVGNLIRYSSQTGLITNVANTKGDGER
jgi:hypothetical protein